MFLKILKHSQENTCVGVWRLANLLKRDSNTVASCEYCKIYNFGGCFWIEWNKLEWNIQNFKIIETFKKEGRRGRQTPLHPPPQKKFFVDVPFFSKSPWSPIFERGNQICTWKLIFHKTKLKLKT